MECLRIHSTADGESHFDQVEIPTGSRQVHPQATAFEVPAKLCGDTPSVSRAFRGARDIQPTLLARADEASE
jgi:hypothetical protein